MLAAEISDQVEPSLERLKKAVARQQRFTVSNVGINEDGDVIGCIGVRCEEESSLRKPALAFGIVVTRFAPASPKTAYGSVMWSIPWVRDQQDGFTAYEARTERLIFDGPRLPGQLVSALPRLEEAFIRALDRGHPPGTILSIWMRLMDGIPLPQTIRL